MATRRTSTPEPVYREQLLRVLTTRLAEPTAEWSTVRCWTGRSLARALKQTRSELEAVEVFSSESPTATAAWLKRTGLARRVPDCDGELYVVEFGASESQLVTPYELLMAARPAGVISYFSAIAYHELSTQPAPHHHVAELLPARPAVAKTAKSSGEVAPKGDSTDAPARLGTELFRWQGIPFLVSKRSRRMLPGVQLRFHGPRTCLRITTVEQTLLDALAKPFHVGGPEVVFEAWRTAIGERRIDEELLSAYLQSMQYPSSTRRVGAMLQIQQHTPGRALHDTLCAAMTKIDPTGPFAEISLLPGLPYQNLNREWLVRVP